MPKNIKQLFDLSGKVAVVTGGAGHLGSALCEGLAEAGAAVAVVSDKPDKCFAFAKVLTEKFGVQAWGGRLDISSLTSAKAGMARVKKEFGKIDILVNNACFISPGSLDKISEADWQTGINGTIGGVFRLTQAVLPYLKNGGAIINIASMYGLVSPDPRIYPDASYAGPPSYAAGKGAVVQFTRYAACHLASRGIRVNSISPGPFPTKQVQANRKFVAKLINKVPLGRIGQPEDLKGAVVFLASDSSAYVTGANLAVDGGWTAW